MPHLPAEVPKRTSTPFDAAYKRMFGLREMVEQFAAGYLPADWSQQVRWETFRLEPTEQTGPGLQQRENDLVCSVERRDGRGVQIFIMLEFQSGVDLAMAVRMNTYIAMRTEQHWREHTGSRESWEVPAVLPVVIYTGSRNWTAGQDLAVKWPAAMGELAEYGQRLKYVLVTAGTARELPGDRANVADALFRIERAGSPGEAREAVGWMLRALEDVENPEVEESVLQWLGAVYWPTRMPGEKLPDVSRLREVPEMLEQHFVPWSDTLLAEGKVQGLEEGVENGRKELLLKQVRQRYGDRTATEVALLLDAVHSLAKLDEIGLSVLTCGTSEAFLARVRAL